VIPRFLVERYVEACPDGTSIQSIRVCRECRWSRTKTQFRIKSDDTAEPEQPLGHHKFGEGRVGSIAVGLPL
jgi:hypothetical protein